MRALFLAFLAFGAFEGLSATPAAAFSYPFCIKGPEYPSGTGDCRFPSYAACQTAASGTYSYCAANPFYAQNSYVPQRKARRGYIEQGY